MAHHCSECVVDVRCPATAYDNVRVISRGNGRFSEESSFNKSVVRSGCFDVGIEKHQYRWAVSKDTDRRDGILRIMKVVDSKSELSEIVGAGHSPCGFAGCLNGGQKKGDEHADDGNDDEKFNEREGEAAKLPILRIYPPPPPIAQIA
jgi:hypothetical protein